MATPKWPRCIFNSADTGRCPNRPSRRTGDFYLCLEHAEPLLLMVYQYETLPEHRRAWAYEVPEQV